MSSLLPSWRTTAARQAIIDFVAQVTEAGGEGFVEPPERIAVFDNDGTLWSEQPAVQGLFILGQLAQMAELDPTLRSVQPWKAAYEHDGAWLNNAVVKHYDGDDSDVKLLFGAIEKAFGDQSVEAFETQVTSFFEATLHPAYGVPLTQTAYAPMIELLDYLRANEFSSYIVSGGGRDFMRPITQTTYGIPFENVVGSAPKMSFQVDTDGSHIMREAGLEIFDDGPQKPIQIWDRVGRRPILAAGNANGDVPMLQFASGHHHPSLCLLVHHNDGERESAYEDGAEQALAEATEQGWTVVSMKDDWSKVFSFL